jgi:hypothetical protein
MTLDQELAKPEVQQWLALQEDPEIQQWLAIRKEEGLKIDAATAEVDWGYGQTFDPYGLYPEPPSVLWQVGREYFARRPGSEIWVWFGDLPDTTHKALLERHESKLSFPAGLPGIDVELDPFPFDDDEPAP